MVASWRATLSHLLESEPETRLDEIQCETEAAITLAPYVVPDIHGVKGKPRLLEQGDKCSVPGCLSNARQLHHCWPRSYLRGQPLDWVCVEGTTIPNTVGLCITHHEWVTGLLGGHRAHIRWNPELTLLEWWERDDDKIWNYGGPLKRQSFLNEQPPESHLQRRLEGLCPTCGRPPKRERPALPKRKVKSWTISVPDDSEQGTEILDNYIEHLAILMGFGEEPSRLKRFHVLTPVLEWVMQSRFEFLADWEAE